MPSAAMRNQLAAAVATSGFPPAISAVTGPAANIAMMVSATPTVRASQEACTPSATAAERSPAPNRRAARAVVP